QPRQAVISGVAIWRAVPLAAATEAGDRALEDEDLGQPLNAPVEVAPPLCVPVGLQEPAPYFEALTQSLDRAGKIALADEDLGAVLEADGNDRQLFQSVRGMLAHDFDRLAIARVCAGEVARGSQSVTKRIERVRETAAWLRIGGRRNDAGTGLIDGIANGKS